MTSTIKVNNIQNQCGQNIINENSNTITIGASGDTIALASGASQTGFGRTGTVDWLTTPKVTGDSPITGATGVGYFLNTTGGTITVNLPAGSAGDIISFADLVILSLLFFFNKFSRKSNNCKSIILYKSSLVKGLNIISSSILFKNSGIKYFFTAVIMSV